MMWFLETELAKSKLKSKIKTNGCHGPPGSDEFRCKLPKHITVSSINTILSHLLKHGIGNAAIDDEQVDYLTNELDSIYPNLILLHSSILDIIAF